MSIPQNKYSTPFEKKARISGITLTILVHLALAFLFISTDIKPDLLIPENTQIILEFVEEKPKRIKTKAGAQPRSINADPKKAIKLVQKSKARLIATKENRGIETTVGKKGNIEVPEPPRPKPINKKALFSSDRNKQDTLAPQTADKVSDRLKAGHPQGNTETGELQGDPSAILKGRSITGTLPLPEYTVENAGRVVVKIRVDQYGTVTNAIPGIKGTTVQDATLWRASRKAALKAKFNINPRAPVVQEGSITYIFKLK